MDTEKKEHSTLKEKTYIQLRNKILDGEYKANEQLKETTLAQSFNISRTPLREVLKQLSGEGLLINIPNRGVFVRKITLRDIDEIFEMRLLLESYAIERTVSTLNKNKISKLKAMRKRILLSADDMTKYTQEDVNLHDLFFELSENSILMEMNKKISSLFQPFRSIPLKVKGRLEDSVVEHVNILDAIIEGETEKAKSLNEVHLVLARDEAKRQIKRKM